MEEARLQDAVAGVAPEAVWRQLQRTYLTIARCLEHRLLPAGITPQQALVLDLIRGGEEPMTPTRMAQALGQETQGITGVLDRMERRGWLRRVRDLADRRAIRLALTDAGVAKLEAVAPVGEGCIREVFAELPPETLATLTAALARLHARAA